MFKLTIKELNAMKREVTQKTTFKAKDIDIQSFTDTEITVSYYASNYDKATNNKSYQTITR